MATRKKSRTTRRSATNRRPAANSPAVQAAARTKVREREAAATSRARDNYGGFNVGAAFFGWLVAVALGVLLTAIVSAAGGVVALTQLDATPVNEVAQSVDTIGIVSVIILLAIAALAYYAGGYVAGRMSRFDGGRQGFGVWAIGLIITLLLAAVGAGLGAEYNVLQQLNLPTIPVDGGSFATGGLIATLVIVLVSVLAAIGGGKAGEAYHRKVDAA